ncbi:MAG: acyl-CoA dehydrogenase [Saprospiraceae bacterium]|jgi:acyl-CoA dehydrogenase
MKHLIFNEEHDLFRSGLRDFLKSEVIPHVDEWEETGVIDPAIWKKMGEMGYFSMVYPEQYGGLGLDHLYTVVLCEELQRVHSGGFAAAIWAHVYLAMTHLNSEGSEEIKEKYLSASISGDKVGCLCITEPYGGSDVAAMRTSAVQDGDSYILNGSKTFITNGVFSDYLIVVAKTDAANSKRAMGIFLVDRDTPGVSATKLNKLGWRASDTGEIAFDNVRIPLSHLMGDKENGFYYVMQHFSLERLIMGVNAHARAEYALEYTLGYMSEREAFGKKINEFQALRHRIAEMATEIEIIKSFNYQTVYRMTQGEYVVKEASMSKLQSTTVADKVIYDCIQMLGGYGFMEDYPLARMWRDSRLGPIGGGTSEILKEIIAKIVIDNKSYEAKL